MTPPKRPPKSDAEWARNTESRLLGLEQPRSVRVGQWVINSVDGKLVATRPGEKIVLSDMKTDDLAKKDDVRGSLSNIQTAVNEAQTSAEEAQSAADTAQDAANTAQTSADGALPRVVFDALQPGGLNIASDPTMSTASLWNDTSRESYAIANIGYWGFKSLAMTCLDPDTWPRVYFIRDSEGDPAELIVTEDDKFDFSVRVRGDGDNSASGKTAWIRVHFSDSTGVLSSTYEDSETKVPSTSGWTKLEMDVVVPAGYDTAAFLGMVTSTVGVGDVYYWDNPVILETTKPTNLAEALFGQKQLASTIVEEVVPELPQDRVTDLPTDMAAKLPRETFDAITPGGRNIATDPTMSTASMWQDDAPGTTYAIGNIGYWGIKSLEVTCVTPASNPSVYFVRNSEGYRAGIITQGGDKFDFSCYVRKHSGNVGSSTFRLLARVTDSTGVLEPNNIDFSSPVTPSTLWQRVSTDVSIPAGYDTVEFRGYFADSTAGDKYYVDTPTIRETTAPTNLAEALFGQKQIATTIVEGVVPELPQSRVTDLEDDLAGAYGAAEDINIALFAQPTPGTTIGIDKVSELGTNLDRLGAMGLSGSNLVPDPSVEDTSLDAIRSTYALTGSGSTWTHDDTHYVTGTRSLKCVYSGSSYPAFKVTPTLVDTSFPVQPGQVFYLSQSVYADAANTGANHIRLYLTCYEDDGTPHYPGYDVGGINPAGGSWESHEVYAEVPAGCYTARAGFGSIRPECDAGDAFWFDAFRLYEVTDASKINQALFGSAGPGVELDGDAIPVLPQSKVTDLESDLGTAQSTANTAVTNAATADAKAVAAQGTADAALPKDVFSAVSVNNLASDPDMVTAALWAGGGDYYCTKEISAEQSYSGATSLKLTATLSPHWSYASVLRTPDGEYRTMSCKPGDTFSFSCLARQHASNATPRQTRVFIGFLDTNGVLSEAGNGSGVTTPDDDWVELTQVATCPPGYDRVRFLIQVAGSPTPGDSYYFDRPVVKDITEAYNAQAAAEAASEALSVAIRSGSNIVLDGGFEDSGVWSAAFGGGPRGVTTEQKHGGAQSLKFGPLAGGVTYAYVDADGTASPGSINWPTSEGRTYYVEAWVYPHASNVGTTGHVRFNARFVNTQTTADGFANAAQTNAADLVKGQWQKLSGYLTNSGDFDTWGLYLRHDASCNVGDIYYWDDVYVVEVTEAYNAQVAAAAAQSTADGAVVDAATADAKAVTAQSDADTANLNVSIVQSVKGPNMVPDPGSEDATLDAKRLSIAGGTYSFSTAQYRTGTRSMLATYAGSGYPTAPLTPNLKSGEWIPVQPGQVFYLSQWIYAHASNTGTGDVGLFLHCQSEAGANHYPNTTSSFDAQEWVQQSVYLTVPDGYYKMRPLFAAVRPGNNSGDKFYFDNFEMYEVTEAYNAAVDAATADAKAVAAQSTADDAVSNAATAQTAADAAQAAADALQIIADNTIDDLSTVQDEAADAQAAADAAQAAADAAQAEADEARAVIDLRAKDFENLVAGSSFENDNPWPMAAGMSVASDQAHTGSKSLKFNGTGWVNSEYPVNYEVQPGDQFYVEFWARRDSAFDHSGGDDGSRFRLTRSNGSTFLSVHFKTGQLPSADTWYKLSGIGTVPSDVGPRMRIMIYAPPPSSSGTVWLDDIVVRRIKTADMLAELPQSKVTDLPALSSGVFKKLSAGPNMVVDPTFTDADLWACTSIHGSYEISSTRSHSASTSYKSTPGYGTSRNIVFFHSDSRALEWNDPDLLWKVQPNQVFYVECYVYSDAGNLGPGNIRVAGYAVDSTGSNSVQYRTVFGGLNALSISNTGVWTKLYGYVDVPSSGYDRFMVYVHASDGGTAEGDVFYIDDAVVKDVTEAYEAQAAADAADGKAVTADGKAVTAQAAADAADSKAEGRLLKEQFDAVTGVGNLVSDPDVKTASLWAGSGDSGCTPSITGDQAYAGSTSLKMTCTGSSTSPYIYLNRTTGGNIAWVPVEPGDTFSISAWFRSHTSNPSPKQCRVFIGFRDSDNNETGHGSGWIQTVDDGWVQASIPVATAPEGTVQARFLVQLIGAGTVEAGDIYYVDRAVVREITAANAAQVSANVADGKAVTAQNTIEAVAQSTNLLVGPNFEDTSITRFAYNSAPLEYSTAQKFQGSRSLKWTNTLGSWAGVFLSPTPNTRDFIVRPGDKIRVKGQLKPDAGNVMSVGYVRLWLRWYNSADGTYQDDGYHYINNTAMSSSWQALDATGTCPAGRDVLSCFVLSDPTTTVGNSYYLDAVSIQEVTDVVTAQSAAATADGKAVAAQGTADSVGIKVDGITVSGSNLVPDPSLEESELDSLRSLTGGSFSYATDYARTGSRSLKYVLGSINQYYRARPNFTSDLPVQPGQVFYLSQWVRAHPGNTGNNRVELYFAPHAGATPVWQLTSYLNVPSDGQWHKISGYSVVPSGCHSAWGYFCSARYGCNAGDIFWFDDFEWYEVTDAYNAKAAADAAQSDADTAQTAANAADANADTRLPHTSFDAYLVGANNIVVNPTFEDTSFYLGGGGSYSTTHKHWGTQSLKVTASASDHYVRLVSNATSPLRIQAQAGQHFYIEYWVYAPTSNVGSGYGRACAVGLWGYDASYVYQQALIVEATVGQIGEGSWVKVSGTVGPFTDTDITNAIVYLYVDIDVPAGDVLYFDDVVVKEVTEAVAAQAAADAAQGTANTADGKADTNETAIDQVGEVLVGEVVTPVNSAVSNIVQFFASLLGWQANSNAAQVAAISNTSQRNPVWVSRHPVADVSFPESLLLETALLNSTGAASAGTAHTHPLSDGLAQAAVYSVEQEASRGAYVTVGATVLHTHIGMMLRKSSGAALNNVFLEVYREKGDGGLILLESHDVASELSTSTELIEVELDEAIVAQAGERYLVRVWNDSSVATQLWAQCILNTSGMQNNGWWTGNAGTTENASYSSGDATTHRNSTSRVAFAELASPNASAADAAYSDDFNDRSELGNLWLLKSSSSNQLTVSFNKVAYYGITSGNQNGLYIYPTSSDRMFASAYLSTISLVVGDYVGIITNANRDLSQVVVLAVNGLGTKIYSGAWNSLTQRATTGTGGTGTYSIEYDPSTGIYTGRKNGSSIITWNDSGDLMDHGADNRYGGLRIVDTGGTIDNFILKDFVPE